MSHKRNPLQIHANICMRAVVVTETLDWRLHGLDLMTEHMATGDLPLMSASWMVGAQYKPSEIAKCEWGAIQQGPPWAVDSWGLGCLMQVSHRMHMRIPLIELVQPTIHTDTSIGQFIARLKSIQHIMSWKAFRQLFYYIIVASNSIEAYML